MAIAGSGGWVPSCRVVAHFDRKSGRRTDLTTTGIVQNKPAELVFSDEHPRAAGTLAEAIVRLRRGEAIQCDMCNGQYLRLRELWESESRS